MSFDEASTDHDMDPPFPYKFVCVMLASTFITVVLALQVASMKRLLEEKNAAMERMKRKLDEARAAGRGAATADRSEAARLTDR